MLADDFFSLLNLMQRSALQSFIKPVLKLTSLDYFFSRPINQSKFTLFVFTEVYLSSSWLSRYWYRRYILSPLIRQQFDSLMEAADILRKYGLWTSENFL